MKGIGNYGIYRQNANAVYKTDKKQVKNNGAKGSEKATDSAAEYQMSDRAKSMEPDELKNYQKSSGGLSIETKKEVEDGIELSEAAQNLLKELKEKYGDIDFFVAEFSTDEEAQKYHSQSTKKYSCVIDPKTLEEMAADESVKEKYVGIIDSADEQFDKLKEELGDDSKEIARMGINVDKDGVVSYFAELTNETKKMQQEALEETKARRAQNKENAEKLAEKRAKEKKEKIKAEEAAEEKAEETTQVNSNRIEATSMEELLSKLREAIAGRKTETATDSAENVTETAKDAVPGQNFDMMM